MRSLQRHNASTCLLLTGEHTVGYRHEITGGQDGGYNAPFDINGDGQYIDNWAKVSTQWKHKKGTQQLKQAGAATKAGVQKPQLKQADEKKPAQAAKAIEPAQMDKLGAVPTDFVWKRGYKYLGKYQGGSDQIWHRGYDVHPGPTNGGLGGWKNHPGPANGGLDAWKNHPGPTNGGLGAWKNHPGPANGGADAWKWYKGPQGKGRIVSLAREEPSDMVWQSACLLDFPRDVMYDASLDVTMLKYAAWSLRCE
jgi:hypothetical protein